MAHLSDLPEEAYALDTAGQMLFPLFPCCSYSFSEPPCHCLQMRWTWLPLPVETFEVHFFFFFKIKNWPSSSKWIQFFDFLLFGDVSLLSFLIIHWDRQVLFGSHNQLSFHVSYQLNLIISHRPLSSWIPGALLFLHQFLFTLPFIQFGSPWFTFITKGEGVLSHIIWSGK